MSSLIKKFKLDMKIYNVNSKTIKDALSVVYNDDKYKFLLNSELIDINNRFRIFRFKDKNYIAKKNTIEKGKNELLLTQKAYELLNGKTINNFTINILKPIFEIYLDNAYIITEYKGQTLQEILYEKKLTNPISIDNLFSILNEFKNNGIIYRGFLPRNTVVKDNQIYLFDWEDAFFVNQNEFEINYFWKTNFFLNWGYFYDIKKLKKEFSKYKMSRVEPKLTNYEKNYCLWTNYEATVSEIRKKIMSVVLSAESPINKESDNFYIMPNDLAHLISDLYNSDFDVLFDIVCFELRKCNEILFEKIVEYLSFNIVNSFLKKENIKLNAINLIMFMFECTSLDLDENILNNILKSKSEIDLFNIIKENEKFNLTINILNNKFLKKDLESILKKILYKYNKSSLNQSKVISLYNYIFNIIKEGEIY